MSKRRKSDDVQPQSPRSFLFVNAKPCSALERTDLQRLIRSNAKSKYWQQRKKTSTLARLLSSSTQLIAPTSKTDALHIHGDLTDSRPLLQGSQQCRLHGIERVLLQIYSSSSMDSVGIGQLDPFGAYPSELPVHVVNPILAQACQTLLQIFPQENGNIRGSAAAAVLRKCLDQRTLFHALLLYQFARNQLRPDFRSKDSRQMTLCHLETVKGINSGIQQILTSCDDDILLAVLALIISGPVANAISPKSPRQGPLKALQSLDIYEGALEMVPIHIGGMMKMVSIRGGLSDIKIPGLAQQLSFSDVVGASQHLTRPLLKFASIYPSIETRLNAVCQYHSQDSMGKGFAVLIGLLHGNKLLHLCPVLQSLRVFTFAVRDYVEGRPGAASLSFLADARLYAQHCLMSLSTSTDREPGETEEENTLYQLCRLGATVYSLPIVFPLPPVSAPFTTLGVEVKKTLAYSAAASLFTQAPQLMLWIMAMGAISSFGSTERTWYVSMLAAFTQRLQMQSWTEMREALQDFLWFGDTSDVEGADLWTQIQLENALRTVSIVNTCEVP